MLDLKFVRENPEVVKQNIKNKFQDSKLPLVDEVIELDVQRLKEKYYKCKETNNVNEFLETLFNYLTKRYGNEINNYKDLKPLIKKY